MVANNETLTELKWGSKELSEAVKGNYFKAEKGKVYEITILKNKNPMDRGVIEIGGKLSRKFDISILCDGQEFIWSVGKNNLDFFDKSTSNKFNVMLMDKSYSIIPLKN